jgi:hypothetical protein
VHLIDSVEKRKMVLTPLVFSLVLLESLVFELLDLIVLDADASLDDIHCIIKLIHGSMRIQCWLSLLLGVWL